MVGYRRGLHVAGVDEDEEDDVENGGRGGRRGARGGKRSRSAGGGGRRSSGTPAKPRALGTAERAQQPEEQQQRAAAAEGQEEKTATTAGAGQPSRASTLRQWAAEVYTKTLAYEAASNAGDDAAATAAAMRSLFECSQRERLGVPGRRPRTVASDDAEEAEPQQAPGQGALLAAELDQQRAALEIAFRELQEGQLARATRALQSGGLLPITHAVKDKLRAKYPQRAADAPALVVRPADEEQVPRFGPEQVRALIDEKPRTTGGGDDGWKYAHMKDVLKEVRRPRSGLSEAAFLGALTVLLQDIAMGKVDPSLVRCVRLVALRKAVGSEDPRPIGIGRLFVSMATALVTRSKEYKEQLLAAVGPTELAHGVSGGCEAVPHSLRAAAAMYPDEVQISTDAENAFNSLDRQEVLDGAPEVPAAGPLVGLLYGGSTAVKSDVAADGSPFELEGQEGVNQGCGLGGGLFSVALRKAVDAVLAKHPKVRILGIADDRYLQGMLADVFPALETYRVELAKRGLKLQLPKCRAWSPAGVATISAACAAAGIVAADGIMVAGTPVGTAAFVEEHLRAKVDELEQYLERIGQVYVRGKLSLRFGAQQLLLLVRQCVAPCTINYWLRTVPPDAMRAHARRFDASVHRLLCTILGADQGQYDYNSVAGAAMARRAQLRISDGGLGLTSAEAIGASAYAGSVALTGHLVRSYLGDAFDAVADGARALPHFEALVQQGAFANVEDYENMDTEAALTGPVQGLQRLLAQRVQDAAAKDVAASLADPQARADFMSGQGEGGRFLHLNPGALKYLGIADEHFIILLRHRLGLPALDLPNPLPCPDCPPQTINSDGGHVYGCVEMGIGKAKALRTKRHSALQSSLLAALRKLSHGATTLRVAAEPQLEDIYDPVPGAKPSKDGRGGRGDLLLTHGGDVSTVLDLVITYPRAVAANGAVDQRMATVPGSAAKKAHERKVKQYSKRWNLKGSCVRFLPFALETGGRMHPHALAFLKGCVEKYVSTNKREEWTAEERALYASKLSDLLMSVSVSVARGRAVSLQYMARRANALLAGHAAPAPPAAGAMGSEADSEDEGSDGYAGSGDELS